MLETSLASQIIKTYSTFSKENQQWIWPIILIITTLLLITFVTIAVYCYCKGSSIIHGNPALDYNRVSYTTASHHSFHPLPNVPPVSVVSKVTPQVTVELIETPVQNIRKTPARREKRQLRTRSASSLADERSRPSEQYKPEGGLDF